MRITTFISAGIISVSTLFSGCGKSSDHHAPAVQDSPANIRRTIDEMLDNQATASEPIEVVVGVPMDFAQQISEEWAAHFIQTRLNDELKARYSSRSSGYNPVVRKYDFEVSNTFDKHRIYVGFEWSNKHVATLRNSFLERQYKAIPLDKGRIEGYAIGKKFIVVTGDQPVNVMAAGFALSEYDHTLNNGTTADINCSIGNVTGHYPDVSISVEKP